MNLNFRPLRDEQDYADMTQIDNATNDACNIEWHNTVERVRESLKPMPNDDPAHDLSLVE